MQNVRNLDHLNLTVYNLKESIAWYQAVFGFFEVESGVQDSGPWAIVKSGDAMLCMYQYDQFRAPEDRHSAKIHGINHFALRILDESRFSRIVDQMNIAVEYGGPLSYPHSTSWYIKDLNGYSIEVVRWDDDKISFPS